MSTNGADSPLIPATATGARADPPMESELWRASSFGSAGVRDLTKQTPRSVAESIVLQRSTIRAEADQDATTFMRSVALTVLTMLKSVEQHDMCPRCGNSVAAEMKWPRQKSPATNVAIRKNGLIVTGATAFDQLMTYPGLFGKQFSHPPHPLNNDTWTQTENELAVSRYTLSVVAETYSTRHGGIAANICYGMSQIGLSPVLLSTVGTDCSEYLGTLEDFGVDIQFVREFERPPTARFDCITDEDRMQVATFYEGASVHESEISLADTAHRLGTAELALITSSDTTAMLRHVREAKSINLRYAIDPSQRLRQGLLSQAELRELVEGAEYLIHNGFERSLLETTAGWTSRDVLERISCRVTTMGARGTKIEFSGGEIHVDAAVVMHVADTTGVGDAFRAGFYGGLAHGLDLEQSAKLGSVLAALDLEVLGTQEYRVTPDELAKRWRDSYTDKQEDEITARVFGI